MIPNYLKQPLPPQELIFLKSLQCRMNLPGKYKLKIKQLTKGYEGEKKFFTLLNKQLPPNAIILNNLMLKSNDTTFQIDSLLIYENKVSIFEVKNFKGDFSVSNDRWFKIDRQNEIINPLLQIERSKYLLRKLLLKLGFNHEVRAYLIFINNEFTIYNLPVNKNIILPTQINRFTKYLSSKSYTLIENDQKLIEQLSSRHLNKAPQFKFQNYNFNNLKKGIICTDCYKFLFPLNRAYLFCRTCNKRKAVESAILKSITEFKILFPDKKITTNFIYKWCKIIKSKKTIRRVLAKHFKQVNAGRYTYYIKHEEEKRY